MWAPNAIGNQQFPQLNNGQAEALDIHGDGDEDYPIL